MKIKIYRIVDPETQRPVYVGQTMNELWFRLSSHLSSPKNDSLSVFVSNMRAVGKKPKIELIEEVSSAIANEREQYWINEYRKNGINLLNCKNRQPNTRRKSRA